MFAVVVVTAARECSPDILHLLYSSGERERERQGVGREKKIEFKRTTRHNNRSFRGLGSSGEESPRPLSARTTTTSLRVPPDTRTQKNERNGTRRQYTSSRNSANTKNLNKKTNYYRGLPELTAVYDRWPGFTRGSGGAL